MRVWEIALGSAMLAAAAWWLGLGWWSVPICFFVMLDVWIFVGVVRELRGLGPDD